MQIVTEPTDGWQWHPLPPSTVALTLVMSPASSTSTSGWSVTQGTALALDATWTVFHDQEEEVVGLDHVQQADDIWVPDHAEDNNLLLDLS